MKIASDLIPHRARGCPFITNVDGEDFVVDGITKYDGYGDECRGIKFAGVAIFQDVEEKLIFPFRFEYSYDCLLYTSPSPRDMRRSRMPSSA